MDHFCFLRRCCRIDFHSCFCFRCCIRSCRSIRLRCCLFCIGFRCCFGYLFCIGFCSCFSCLCSLIPGRCLFSVCFCSCFRCPAVSCSPGSLSFGSRIPCFRSGLCLVLCVGLCTVLCALLCIGVTCIFVFCRSGLCRGICIRLTCDFARCCPGLFFFLRAGAQDASISVFSFGGFRPAGARDQFRFREFHGIFHLELFHIDIISARFLCTFGGHFFLFRLHPDLFLRNVDRLLLIGHFTAL